MITIKLNAERRIEAYKWPLMENSELCAGLVSKGSTGEIELQEEYVLFHRFTESVHSGHPKTVRQRAPLEDSYPCDFHLYLWHVARLYCMGHLLRAQSFKDFLYRLFTQVSNAGLPPIGRDYSLIGLCL